MSMHALVVWVFSNVDYKKWLIFLRDSKEKTRARLKITTRELGDTRGEETFLASGKFHFDLSTIPKKIKGLVIS